MFVFAIRQKGTNLYLPARRDGRKVGRGFSWDVPIEGGGKHGPRFHFIERGAKQALSLWARGPWVQEPDTHGLGFDLDDVVPGDVVSVKPEVPRNKDDMEIVKFQLVERSVLDALQRYRQAFPEEMG